MKKISSSAFRRFPGLAFAILLLLMAAPLAAQSSSPGPGIDLELINSADGSNTICVNPGQAFSVRLWIRPGSGTASCTPACGTTVAGGNSHIATAVVDIDFDDTAIGFVSAADNPDTNFAAVDGLIQDNSASKRVGWALAGDWTPDATITGNLADPCNMAFLDTSGWAAQFNFTAGAQPSSTILHLRRQSDSTPFALSFADICGSEAYTVDNGGIDEVIDATIYVSANCPAGIFADGFETADTTQWSGSS